ncbi:hypothetical protein ACFFX0_18595 [Citricoccus parietis]|uniref:Uncharacterized protein n=1 Tax=Citricoccus parietis TaxID=592307 RepID=A0ABV5G2E1_9MICC
MPGHADAHPGPLAETAPCLRRSRAGRTRLGPHRHPPGRAAVVRADTGAGARPWSIATGVRGPRPSLQP